MRYGRGEPEDTDFEECTCLTPFVDSASIDPPEPKSILNPWCPVHGKDPDEEYERQRDEPPNFPPED
jgi:hypothetical protein